MNESHLQKSKCPCCRILFSEQVPYRAFTAGTSPFKNDLLHCPFRFPSLSQPANAWLSSWLLRCILLWSFCVFKEQRSHELYHLFGLSNGRYPVGVQVSNNRGPISGVFGRVESRGAAECVALRGGHPAHPPRQAHDLPGGRLPGHLQGGGKRATDGCGSKIGEPRNPPNGTLANGNMD